MSANSQHVLDQVQVITKVSHEHFTSIQQVSSSVNKVNDNNEDINHRAQQLAELAGKLESAVGSFKLNQ
jgi:methyl-accepting chemotaxis protein